MIKAEYEELEEIPNEMMQRVREIMEQLIKKVERIHHEQEEQ